MTKIKPVQGGFKDGRRHVKDGSINKKKQQKYKQTPQGKVALINGSQAKSNGNSKPPKNVAKNFQRSPMQTKSPKGGNKHSNSPKASNSGIKSPQVKVEVEEEKDDTDSSDDDINEGIMIKEEVSAPEDEVDDDDSSDESSNAGTVQAIFGTNLADETDEDDDEFDADSGAEDTVENKGVKMFKGLKKEVKEEVKEEESSEQSDDDDDDESEEDEEDEKAVPGLASLLGASINDESDDEEFEVAENDSDEDEEDSEADEEDSDVEVDQSVNSSIVESSNGDEDDEDEDEEDSDDSNDSDDSSPDITALLGKSIADESDDDDFEGEEESEDDEDEDMSEEEEDEVAGALSSPSKKSKVIKTEEDEAEEDGVNESHDSTDLTTAENDKPRLMTRSEKNERDKKTIFIGNVPKETDQSTLRKIFKKFGTIDTVRIRGIVPENPKMPLKVAAITKKIHPKVNTVCCFVTYKSEDSVAKALSMNGKKLDGNFLRVDHANGKNRPDKKKTVFLGNLPFTIEDNEIWETFKNCGKIDSVRIIRDRKTGLGRGFGYINFESTDGPVLAMNLNGTTVRNRVLRIKVNTPEARKKQREIKQNLKRSLSEAAENASPKKIRTDDSEAVEVATRNSVNAERRTEKRKRSQGEQQRDKSESTSPHGKGEGKYQGQKADAKKKPKQDKSAKRKKRMAAKLLAKPKKPAAN